jgi:hypothetical protein
VTTFSYTIVDYFNHRRFAVFYSVLDSASFLTIRISVESTVKTLAQFSLHLSSDVVRQ